MIILATTIGAAFTFAAILVAIAAQALAALRREQDRTAQFLAHFWSGRPLDQILAEVPADARGIAYDVVAVVRRTHERARSLPGPERAPSLPGPLVEKAAAVVVRRGLERLERLGPALDAAAPVAALLGLLAALAGAILAGHQVEHWARSPASLMAAAAGIACAIVAVIAASLVRAAAARLRHEVETFADEVIVIASRPPAEGREPPPAHAS